MAHHADVNVTLPYTYYTSYWHLEDDGLVDTIADLKAQIEAEIIDLHDEGITFSLKKDGVELSGTDDTFQVLTGGDTLVLEEN